MSRHASELASRLAREAEAVCRHYLSSGKRTGRYWLVGDVHNTPGRSLFVRLQKSPRGPADKWTDAATGEHGDLLDVIRESLGLRDFREVAEEAKRFLKLPRAEPALVRRTVAPAVPARSQAAARRLFAISGPIERTVAEAYLHGRRISRIHHGGSLRFHPRCYYRPDEHLPTESWPAMIGCVTDLDGQITGLHRTWLDPDGFDCIRLGKAPIDTPRRAMGDLLGNAVRFGAADDVLAAGEGIKTMLSLRYVLPTMPMAAALSANHLSAMRLRSSLGPLYIARDADAAGDAAQAPLRQRAADAGIEVIPLSPRLDDFNEDLQVFGPEALRVALQFQLAPERAFVSWSGQLQPCGFGGQPSRRPVPPAVRGSPRRPRWSRPIPTRTFLQVRRTCANCTTGTVHRVSLRPTTRDLSATKRISPAVRCQLRPRGYLQKLVPIIGGDVASSSAVAKSAAMGRSALCCAV